MSMRIWVIMAGIVFTPTAVRGLDVTITTQDLKVGDPIRAKVALAGKVGIESDLLNQSTEMAVGPEGYVELGKVGKPGIYAIRIVDSTKSSNDANILLFVTEQEANIRSIQAFVAHEQSAPSAPLIARFRANVAANNFAVVREAATDVLEKWVPNNVVGVTGTLTICILPGGQAVCLVRLGEHALEYGFVFADALVEKCPDLTADERSELKKWLHDAEAMYDLASLVHAKNIEKLVELFSLGQKIYEKETQDRNGNHVVISVLGNNVVHLVDKTVATLRVLKK